MSTAPVPALPLRTTVRLLAPYAGWILLYAGVWVWYGTGHEVPDIFANTVLYDLVVNMAMPFVLTPVLLLLVTWLGRSSLGRGMGTVFGIVLLVAICGFALWGAVAVLLHFGGWSLAVFVPIIASKYSWRAMFPKLHEQSGREYGLLMLRSLLVPFVCFCPALVICCIVYRRNTLGLGADDYVGLFGIIYFGTQAALDYVLACRIGRQYP